MKKILIFVLLPVLFFAQQAYHFNKFVTYDSGKVGEEKVSTFQIFFSSENPDITMEIVSGERGILKDLKNNIMHTYSIAKEKNGDFTFTYQYSRKFGESKKNILPIYKLQKISDNTFEINAKANRMRRAQKIIIKTKKGEPPFINQFVGEGSNELNTFISQQLQNEFGPLEILEFTQFIGRTDAYYKKRKQIIDVNLLLEAPEKLEFRVISNGENNKVLLK